MTNGHATTHERIVAMAHTACMTGMEARYQHDDINSLEVAEVAAAEALANHWMSLPAGVWGPDGRNEVEQWLRANGHTAVADEIAAKR
jgi:hypothetical protein